MIEATLIVGQTRDTLLAFYTRRPDQPVGIGVQPDPVTPDQVDLTLEEIGGASGRLIPDPAQPGHFVADLPIEAERSYRLTGRVRGSPISASVTTPAQMILVEPVGDTIFLPKQAPNREVRARFASFGDVAQLTAIGVLLASAPDTVFILRFLSSPDTVAVAFVGFGRQDGSGAAGRLGGNITGALGRLSAATTLKRVFVWR